MTFVQNSPILASFLFSLAINMFFFIFAALFKTDKVTDFTYSLSFFLLAPILLFSSGHPFSTEQVLVTLAIMLWALRLGTYLFYRILKIGKDDRFDDKRSNPLAFLRFWILQTLVVWIVMLPFALFLTSEPEMIPQYMTTAGMVVFLLGLIIETVSDMQKFNYRMKTENDGHWVDSGLWKFSRHPNYMGEILVWWGLFVVVIPFLSGLQWLTILGPFTITFFLIFVSGIPLLEKSSDKKYGAAPGYQDYKRRTSLLLILPPKKKA